METKLLVDRFGNDEAINEVKAEWLYDLLVYVLTEMELNPDVLDEKDRFELFEFLFDNDIEVLDFPDINGLRVEVDEQVVGEWAGPEFVMKKDSETGELHYEVTIEHWSLLDNEI